MQWAALIKEREQSGLSVKQWCAENGINKKTYYYRLNRVREELLDTLESQNSLQLASSAAGNALRRQEHQPEIPEFVQLPVPRATGAAVTVWIGNCAVDVHNDAESAVVEQVLKAVSRL